MSLEDGPVILAMLRQDALASMLCSIPPPLSDAVAAELFGRMAQGIASDGTGTRVIEVAGVVAGCISLAVHADSGGLEATFWLSPEFWNRGLATGSLHGALEEAFAKVSPPGILARATGDNPAALRVLQKLGFEPVGQGEAIAPARKGSVSTRLLWLDRCRPTLTLETRRLVLTLPRAADIPRLVAFLDDIEVAKETARVPHPYRRADAVAFLAGQATGSDQAFALRLKDEDGALIGGAGFGKGPDGSYELGYWLGRPYWRQGFATEAARAIIDLLFASTEAEDLHASARVMNGASRRVLEKCGFQHCGNGLSRSRALGGSVPVDRFRLDRATWRSILAWRPAIRHEPDARSIRIGTTT